MKKLSFQYLILICNTQKKSFKSLNFLNSTFNAKKNFLFEDKFDDVKNEALASMSLFKIA